MCSDTFKKERIKNIKLVTMIVGLPTFVTSMLYLWTFLNRRMCVDIGLCYEGGPVSHFILLKWKSN